jgi:hypothetical protein
MKSADPSIKFKLSYSRKVIHEFTLMDLNRESISKERKIDIRRLYMCMLPSLISMSCSSSRYMSS